MQEFYRFYPWSGRIWVKYLPNYGSLCALESVLQRKADSISDREKSMQLQRPSTASNQVIKKESRSRGLGHLHKVHFKETNNTAFSCDVNTGVIYFFPMNMKQEIRTKKI